MSEKTCPLPRKPRFSANWAQELESLLAIARTESALYSNAISLNRPNAAARRAGYGNGQLVLTKQPKDRKQATYWLHWLLIRRYTVSIGLMQVNSDMATQFHLKPEQLLEPCTNLRVGAAILISLYTDLARQMGEGFPALDAALSFYNGGNPHHWIPQRVRRKRLRERTSRDNRAGPLAKTQFVVTVNIVADDSICHRASHRLCWAAAGITTKINHGPMPSLSILPRRLD